MVYLMVLAIALIAVASYFHKPSEVEQVRIPVDPTISRQKKI